MENSFEFCFRDEQKTVAARGAGVRKRQKCCSCVLKGTCLQRMETDV